MVGERRGCVHRIFLFAKRLTGHYRHEKDRKLYVREREQYRVPKNFVTPFAQYTMHGQRKLSSIL